MTPIDHLAEHFDRLCVLDEHEQEVELRKLALSESDREMLAKLLAADRCVGDPIHAVISRGAASINQPTTIRFGPWRLVTELGSGGMGTVFLAQREDGHFDQQVAIKLLRGIPTRDNARRLRQERQILAGLDHPNIARLLDGGETDEGQPWLAMEYIDGLPLIEYASLHASSMADRLKLFESMLDATEHAHQHLIVHRDLKPANVMVTPAGVVKLLDFGIARLLDAGEEALNSTSTQIYSRGYASPEQRDGGTITTASDIYSLGIMLRELLTGRRDPADKSPPLLPALPLDADLAGILAKACAANPQDRYVSAGDLRSDLGNFREGRPVLATAMTRSYRVRKFVGRHQFGVAVTILVVLFGAGFIWRIDRERERAIHAELAAQNALKASVRDAASARAALQFLTDTLSAAAPEVAMSKQISVRQLLDAARAKLAARSGKDQDFAQRMQRLLAVLYSQLGEANIARDLMRDGLAGVKPADGEEALRLADDYEEYSGLLGSLEEGSSAMVAAQTAAEWRVQYAAEDTLLQIRSLQMLAMVQHRNGNDTEAIELLNNARALGVEKAIDDIDVRIESAQILSALLASRGDCEESLAIVDEGFSLAQSLAADSPSRLPLMRAKASALGACGRQADAETVLRDAIAMQDRVVAEGGTRMMSLTNDLALILNDLGRYQEAAEMLQHSDETVRLESMSKTDRAISGVNRAGILENAGDYSASLAAEVNSIALLDEAQLEEDHQVRRRIKRSYARTLGLAGQAGRAWSMLDALRQQALRIEGAESGEYAMVTWQMALLAERMGKQDIGLPLLAEARQRWGALVPPTHPVFAHAQRLSARWAVRQRDYLAAEADLQLAIEQLGRDSTSVVDLAIARSELARVLSLENQDDQARQMLVQAMPVLRKTLLPTEVSRASAERLAIELGIAN